MMMGRDERARGARQLLTGALVLAAIAASSAARSDEPSIQSVEAVPNPRHRGSWVSDVAEVLGDEAEASLDAALNELERRTTVELTIVTVPSLDRDVKEFATELFNHWRVGKRGKDNGVLVFLAVRQRRIEIETGYGVEDVLPDALVGRIIHEHMVPRFKEGDYGGGLAAAAHAMISRLGGSGAPVTSGTTMPAPFTAAEPPEGGQHETEPPDSRETPPDPRTSAEPRSGAFTFFGLLFDWVIGSGLLLLFFRAVDFATRPGSRRPPHLPNCDRSFVRLRRRARKQALSPEQRNRERQWLTFHRVWRCDLCQAVVVRETGRVRMLLEKLVFLPEFFWAWVGSIRVTGGGSTDVESPRPSRQRASYIPDTGAPHDSGRSSTPSPTSSGSFGGGTSGGGGAGGSW